MASKIIACHFINGKINPVDTFGKHWDDHIVWLTFKLLLFWKGDTMECLDNVWGAKLEFFCLFAHFYVFMVCV